MEVRPFCAPTHGLGRSGRCWPARPNAAYDGGAFTWSWARLPLHVCRMVEPLSGWAIVGLNHCRVEPYPSQSSCWNALWEALNNWGQVWLTGELNDVGVAVLFNSCNSSNVIQIALNRERVCTVCLLQDAGKKATKAERTFVRHSSKLVFVWFLWIPIILQVRVLA